MHHLSWLPVLYNLSVITLLLAADSRAQRTDAETQDSLTWIRRKSGKCHSCAPCEGSQHGTGSYKGNKDELHILQSFIPDSGAQPNSPSPSLCPCLLSILPLVTQNYTDPNPSSWHALSTGVCSVLEQSILKSWLFPASCLALESAASFSPLDLKLTVTRGS